MVYSVENFHIFWNTDAEVLRLLINAASERLVQEKNHLKEHKISDILVFRTSIIFVLTSYYKYDDFQKSILSSEGPDVLCTIFYREFLFCCEEDLLFFFLPWTSKDCLVQVLAYQLCFRSIKHLLHTQPLKHKSKKVTKRKVAKSTKAICTINCNYSVSAVVQVYIEPHSLLASFESLIHLILKINK